MAEQCRGTNGGTMAEQIKDSNTTNSVNMIRPVLIPHAAKAKLHNTNECICLRNGVAHAIKANTNNRTWINTVGLTHASIAMNPQTKKTNQAVRTAVNPIHLLSFGAGADTYYWGRYQCVGGTQTFELEYVDDGCASEFTESTTTAQFRSILEKTWDTEFDALGLKTVYEPATFALNNRKEYTPDFWLPSSEWFVEIKGPPPTQVELDKCAQIAAKGFRIVLLHGPPDMFTAYTWTKGNIHAFTEHEHTSLREWLDQRITNRDVDKRQPAIQTDKKNDTFW